jgi:hypothetical protein
VTDQLTRAGYVTTAVAGSVVCAREVIDRPRLLVDISTPSSVRRFLRSHISTGIA